MKAIRVRNVSKESVIKLQKLGYVIVFVGQE